MFYRRSHVVLAMLIAMGLFCGNAAADTLILKDGRKFEGRVVSKSAYLITFEIITAGMKTLKNFAPDEIQEIIVSEPVTAPLATTGTTPTAAIGPTPGTTSAPASPNPAGPTYLVVPLRGEFGKEIVKDVVEKCLEKAKETQASAVVFEITSNGGEVQATIELLDLIVAW